MKRSLLVIVVASALSFVPVYAQAVTASASPTPLTTVIATPTPGPGHAATAKNRAAREAARAIFRAALFSAQNGRDLAFADANATLMQSEGKDKATVQAARAIYRVAAKGIITAYKQAVLTAQKNYRAALAAIGK
ncbi:MAG: hypothetical protein WCP71_00710 [Actinomycetes bacterium]